MTNNFSFQDVYEQNRKRFHFNVHAFYFYDPNKKCFQEGLVTLWNPYLMHKPDTGPMATYFNYTIRYRLIDCIRKQQKQLVLQHHTRLNVPQTIRVCSPPYHHDALKHPFDKRSNQTLIPNTKKHLAIKQ